MSSVTTKSQNSGAGRTGGEPAWEIAYLFPPQGDWSEEEFLTLDTNRLVEFTHGAVKVLPMPTTLHQLIVGHLYGLLSSWCALRKLGTVLFAPMPVRLGGGRYREPDILFMLSAHFGRIKKNFWHGADLVMEVVSEDDPRRDLLTKRAEYARARIPEYWIVDPQHSLVSVLYLKGTRYAVHGKFTLGEQASSKLLPGFAVDVQTVFALASGLSD